MDSESMKTYKPLMDALISLLPAGKIAWGDWGLSEATIPPLALQFRGTSIPFRLLKKGESRGLFPSA
jgi:hypothetical protein